MHNNRSYNEQFSENYIAWKSDKYMHSSHHFMNRNKQYAMEYGVLCSYSVFFSK